MFSCEKKRERRRMYVTAFFLQKCKTLLMYVCGLSASAFFKSPVSTFDVEDEDCGKQTSLASGNETRDLLHWTHTQNRIVTDIWRSRTSQEEGVNTFFRRLDSFLLQRLPSFFLHQKNELGEFMCSPALLFQTPGLAIHVLGLLSSPPKT